MQEQRQPAERDPVEKLRVFQGMGWGSYQYQYQYQYQWLYLNAEMFPDRKPKGVGM
jgi:hypothetical protein